MTNQQITSDPVFQIPDTPADGGLLYIESGCRPTQAAVLDGRKKVTRVAKFDVWKRPRHMFHAHGQIWRPVEWVVGQIMPRGRQLETATAEA